jgi:hypothetical protein
MIGLESDEAILHKLRARLRRMTDEELIRFGKDVRKLAENPFQRQLEEARREWKRRKGNHDAQSVRLGKAFTVWFRLALMATLPIPARPRSPYG